MHVFKKYLLIFFLVSITLNVNSASLEAININSSGKVKNIFLKLSGNYNYRVYALHNPERLVVDIDNCKLTSRAKNFTQQDEIIKAIRYGYPIRDKLRVVFDLKATVEFSAIKNTKQDNILLTMRHSNYLLTGVVKKPTVNKIPLPAKPAGTPKLQADATLRGRGNVQKTAGVSQSISKPVGRRPLRDVVVIIDPGHGGNILGR